MVSANAIKSKKSIAFIIAAVVLLWIASGIIFPSRTSYATSFETTSAPVKVKTETLEAQSLTINHRFYGVTEANRKVNLKAEVEGSVVAINTTEGSSIKEGNVIVTLDIKERDKAVEQAQALVNQRNIEFKSASSLSRKGLNSEAQFMQAKSQLREAEALLALSKTNLEKTKITAPFTGVLDRIHVELGDLAERNNNADIATLIDLDPIIITSDISETMIQKIKTGHAAKADIRGFGEYDAIITYVSKSADPITRTFPIEISIKNPDNIIPEGVTSTLIIPEEVTDIHIVPSSILTLDDTGNIGVRAISEAGAVLFYPIQIINDTKEGLWIKGLPRTVQLITLGQNYVNENTVIEFEATK